MKDQLFVLKAPFTDGPFAKDCYNDPTGKEVIVINSVKNPTPEKCNPTYEWTAP